MQDLGAGSFRLRCKSNADVSERLVAQSVHDSWGLRELTPEKDSLEELFVRLTTGDQPAPP